jgi:hypothetical protein
MTLLCYLKRGDRRLPILTVVLHDDVMFGAVFNESQPACGFWRFCAVLNVCASFLVIRFFTHAWFSFIMLLMR